MHDLPLCVDMSEVEGRVEALRSELRRRRATADKLQQEHKRRTRDHLRTTEQSLNRQLEVQPNLPYTKGRYRARNPY